MILLTHETTIRLGVAPADFRRGIDGFVALCKNELLQEPRDGCVFVFINKARTMIRALSYDGTGYWLMAKRISKGRFTGWPTGQQVSVYYYGCLCNCRSEWPGRSESNFQLLFTM